MGNKALNITVKMDESGIRLDRLVQNYCKSVPKGTIHKWIRTGQVRLDSKRARGGERIIKGSIVRIPPYEENKNKSIQKNSESINFSKTQIDLVKSWLLFENSDLYVINKPFGLPVQGGTKIKTHMEQYFPILKDIDGNMPKLVHRLDRDTSGLLLLAKHMRSARNLSSMFKKNLIKKTYWAIVVGRPKKNFGRIDFKLEKTKYFGNELMLESKKTGLEARTNYIVRAFSNGLSWLELNPITGRTHQIRAHCKILGTPILGDGKYGSYRSHPFIDEKQKKLQLHLLAREIELPNKNGKSILFKAPIPSHMNIGFKKMGIFPAQAD